MVYLTFSVLKLLWLAFTSFSIFYERNELPLDLRCSLPPFASVLRNKKGIKQEKLCQSNRICKEKLGFKGCTGQLSSWKVEASKGSSLLVPLAKRIQSIPLAFLFVPLESSKGSKRNFPFSWWLPVHLASFIVTEGDNCWISESKPIIILKVVLPWSWWEFGAPFNLTIHFNQRRMASPKMDDWPPVLKSI